MHLTWLDSNSWLIELAGKRILLDPWLIGPLKFGNADWFFKGVRSRDRDIPSDLDVILLSQGIEDHAHPETLKQLDPSIPVVASPSAAKVARSLGFTTVIALQHGQAWTLDSLNIDSLKIVATIGSQLGPFLRENGYILQASGETVYYEPHGSHDANLKSFAPIDVVITPLIDLALPVVGPIIKGRDAAIELAKTLQPRVMIPTAAGGDIAYEGMLVPALKAIGSNAEMRDNLAAAGLATQVIEPIPGDRTEIVLPPAPVLSSQSID